VCVVRKVIREVSESRRSFKQTCSVTKDLGTVKRRTHFKHYCCT